MISELIIEKNYHLENIFNAISRVPGRGSLESCTFRVFPQHIPFVSYLFLLKEISGRDRMEIQNGLQGSAIKMMGRLAI